MSFLQKPGVTLLGVSSGEIISVTDPLYVNVLGDIMKGILSFDNFAPTIFKLESLASEPSTPQEGRIFWDTTASAAKVFNGTVFRKLGAALNRDEKLIFDDDEDKDTYWINNSVDDTLEAFVNGISQIKLGASVELQTDLTRAGDNRFNFVSNKAGSDAFRFDHRGQNWTNGTPSGNTRLISIGGDDGAGGFLERVFIGETAGAPFRFGIQFQNGEGVIRNCRFFQALGSVDFTSSGTMTFDSAASPISIFTRDFTVRASGGNTFHLESTAGGNNYWTKSTATLNKRFQFGLGAEGIRQTSLATNVTADGDVTFIRLADGGGTKSFSGAIVKITRDIINATSDTAKYLVCRDEQAGVDLFLINKDGNVEKGNDSTFEFISNKVTTAGLGNEAWRFDNPGLNWTANPPVNTRLMSFGGDNGAGVYLERMFLGVTAGGLFGIEFSNGNGVIRNCQEVRNPTGRLNLQANFGGITIDGGSTGISFLLSGDDWDIRCNGGVVRLLLGGTSGRDSWSRNDAQRNLRMHFGLNSDGVRDISDNVTAAGDFTFQRLADGNAASSYSGDIVLFEQDVINHTGDTTNLFRWTNVNTAGSEGSVNNSGEMGIRVDPLSGTDLNVGGNARVGGKLTVVGVIDPTQLLLTGSTKKIGATDAGTIFLAPFADSTGAIQVRKADDTTVVATFDTINSRLGIGSGAAPTVTLDIIGDSRITGNLMVEGTTQTIKSETVLFADNHLYLNDGYTAVAAQTGGLAINYLPTSTTDTSVGAGYTAGVVAVSNPTVITTGSATFSVGDLIQISNSTNNDGLFEVLSHVTTTLTIRGIGLTGTVEDFTQNQFVTEAAAGVITKINVSVLRAGTAGTWEAGFGSTTGVAFDNFQLQAVALTTGSIPFSDSSGRLAQDNANLFWDDTNNRLGVGTNAPITLLHVAEGIFTLPSIDNRRFVISDPTFAAMSLVSSATGEGHINFGSPTDIDAGRIIYRNSTNQLGFGTNAISDAMIIDASGNVGIGTTSPGGLLHVAQAVDGSAVNLLLENSQENSGASLNETSELRFAFGGINDVARVVAGKLTGYQNAANENSFIAFYTDLAGTASERMRIKNDDTVGVVGIGTTTPTSTLHIKNGFHESGFTHGALQIQQSDGKRMFLDGNDIDAADSNLFLQDISTFDIIMVRAGGNVGINTGTPGAMLEIEIDSGDGIGLLIDQNDNNISLQIDSEATTVDVIDIPSPSTTTGIVFDVNADSLTTGKILDLTSNSSTTNSRILVDIINDNILATGAVPLRIQQDSTADILQAFDGATQVFTIDDVGNVGIQNGAGNSPQYRFDIGDASYFAINGSFAHIIQHNSAASEFWSIAPRNGGDLDIAVTTTDPRPTGATIGTSDNAVSIKSNKDVDFIGSVTASNLKNHALVEIRGGISPNRVTSSTTFVTLESASAVTFSGRPVLCFVCVTMFPGTTNVDVELAIQIDSGSDAVAAQTLLNNTEHITVQGAVIVTPTAGSHTLRVRWRQPNNAGTLNLDANDQILLHAIEL